MGRLARMIVLVPSIVILTLPLGARGETAPEPVCSTLVSANEQATATFSAGHKLVSPIALRGAITAKREALQAWIAATKAAPGQVRAVLPAVSGNAVTAVVTLNDNVAGTVQQAGPTVISLAQILGLCDAKPEEQGSTT